MIDKEMGNLAIFRLREARKAVLESGAYAECWITKDLEMHIKGLQRELEG